MNPVLAQDIIHLTEEPNRAKCLEQYPSMLRLIGLALDGLADDMEAGLITDEEKLGIAFAIARTVGYIQAVAYQTLSEDAELQASLKAIQGLEGDPIKPEDMP